MLKVWFIWEMGEQSNQQLGRGCLHRDFTGSFARRIFEGPVAAGNGFPAASFAEKSLTFWGLGVRDSMKRRYSMASFSLCQDSSDFLGILTEFFWVFQLFSHLYQNDKSTVLKIIINTDLNVLAFLLGNTSFPTFYSFFGFVIFLSFLLFFGLKIFGTAHQ